MAQDDRQAGRRKVFHGVVFAALLLGVTVAGLEILSFAAMKVLDERFPARKDIQATLAPVSSTGQRMESLLNRPQGYGRHYLLHPYFGIARNPRSVPQIVNTVPVNEPVNEHGFFGPSPVQPKSDDRFVVGITGGSVALELYLYGREALVDAIKHEPRVRGKQVEVISLALEGAKQPQQLMITTFMLNRGMHLDALINVDGFNEIKATFADNAPVNVPLDFPGLWPVISFRATDPEAVALVSAMMDGMAATESWRRFFSLPVIRSSNFMLALWHVLNTRLTNRTRVLYQEYAALALKQSAEGRGGFVERTTPEEVTEKSVAIWRRSAEQLYTLCRLYGIRYVQVLQPSQYLLGSKRLTGWERQNAYAPSSDPGRLSVERSYPALIRETADMARRGVPISDLTGLFEQVDQTIYKDDCCHFTNEGYAIMGKAVGKIVAAELRKRP